MRLLTPRVLLVCLGIGLTILAALSLRYFSQYGTLTAMDSGMTGEAQQIALEADDVQVVGRTSGKIRWRLTAQTVTLSRDRRMLAIAGIHKGALYADAGQPTALLTAQRASYETPFGILGLGGAGLLRVDGDVRVHVLSPAHPDLRTQRIVWDSGSNELSCPGPVTAAVPKLSVAAGNADYFSPPGAPAQGTLHLGGGIHAVFAGTRGTAILDCPGLTWSADTQAAQTTGPVRAQIPGGLGTASAAGIAVNTHTGDMTGHGLQGTLRLSPEVH